MWKIYKHTFPNGKVYIGQTKQSLPKRFGNNYIQTYNSIADANRALGKASNASNIVQVCKGKRKQAYGYKWRYVNYE